MKVGSRPARYPRFLAVPTRWMDNDIYGHVDNVINAYLIGPGGLDIHGGAVAGGVRRVELPVRSER